MEITEEQEQEEQPLKYCKILKSGEHKGVYYNEGEIYLVNRHDNDVVWIKTEKGVEFAVTISHYDKYGLEAELIDSLELTIEIW